MKNLDVKLWIRTVFLVLAFVNAGLQLVGYNPIPVDEEAVTNFVTLAFLGITTILSWYFNNNTTKEAKWAQQKLDKYKAEAKMAKATGQAPINKFEQDDTEGNL